MTKDQILSRMDALGFTRQTLAAATGYKYEYVRDRLTPTAAEPSPKFIAAVERAFSEEERRREVSLSKPDSSIWDLVYFSGAEIDRIDRAKKVGGYTSLPPMYRDAVIEFADRLLEKEIPSIAPISSVAEDSTPYRFTPRPNILAAAGSPIAAEIMDLEGVDDTIQVRIHGLSMEPVFHDGDVISMKHKRVSRSPYMKKGLIYLVQYDGGYTVKRYNSRPANPEEKGEEWVQNGKVKTLESLNPEYPEIIIKQPIEWIAWMEG